MTAEAETHRKRKLWRKAGLLFMIAFFVASAGYLLSSWQKKRQDQVAGICHETGERLSDEAILRIATNYGGYLSVARGYWASRAAVSAASARGLAAVDVRIVPEASLRAEEQVPSWVRNSGGFRAYVEILINPRVPSQSRSARFRNENLWIVSNCGKVRAAIYDWGWLW